MVELKTSPSTKATSCSNGERQSTPPITIKSDKSIKTDDFDFLIIFLESKRHSCGGEIIQTTQVDSRTLQVVYASSETANRVLEKGSFKFKDYTLTATITCDHDKSIKNVDGLIGSMLERDTRRLVIRNRNILNASQNDKELVYLLAEDLVRNDNNIVRIDFADFVPCTFYVTYESPIDRTFLEKDSKWIKQEKRIELLDAFITNTFVVFFKQPKASKVKKASFSVVKSKILNLVRDNKKRTAEEEMCFLVEPSASFSLIKFRETVDDGLLQSIESCLAVVDAQLAIEQLPNFQLMKHAAAKYCDNEWFDLSVELLNQFGKKNDINVKANSPKTKAMTPVKLSPLPKQPLRFKLDLGSLTPLAICLHHCSQISDNLLDFLYMKNRALILLNLDSDFFIEEVQSMPVKINEDQWRIRLQKWLNEFIAKYVRFESIQLVPVVQTTQEYTETLNLYEFVSTRIKELRQSMYKSSTYFEVSPDKRYLYGYGMPTNLERNLAFLRDEISKRASIKATNLIKNAPPLPSAAKVNPPLSPATNMSSPSPKAGSSSGVNVTVVSSKTTINNKLNIKFTNDDDIVLDDKFHPIECIVLENFVGKYFKDFSTRLANKFNATLEKHNDETSELNGYRVRGNETALAELKKTRQDLLNHVRQFFSADFTQKLVKVSSKESFEKLKISTVKANIHLKWKNSNHMEITGLCSEINKFVKAITDKFASDKTVPTASQATTSITHFVVDLPQTPSKPLLLPLGAWEEYSKCIGSKLLVKMGYTPGRGLGKTIEGRLEPVSWLLLPKSISLDTAMAMREKRLLNYKKYSTDSERKVKKRQSSEKLNVVEFVSSTLSQEVAVRLCKKLGMTEPSSVDSKEKPIKSLDGVQKSLDQVLSGNEALQIGQFYLLRVRNRIRETKAAISKLEEDFTRTRKKRKVPLVQLTRWLYAKEEQLDRWMRIEFFLLNKKDKKIV